MIKTLIFDERLDTVRAVTDTARSLGDAVNLDVKKLIKRHDLEFNIAAVGSPALYCVASCIIGTCDFLFKIEIEVCLRVF